MGFFDAICPDCEARAFNPWTGLCKACGYDNAIGITSASQSSHGSRKRTGTNTEVGEEGEEGEAPSEENRWW